jgi:hypothetical protein
MISIGSQEERLSSEAVRYWSKNVLANLKIGAEIEFDVEHGYKSELMRTLTSKLNPSGSLIFSRNGVYEIVSDGSIPNGIELKTSGRRLDFLNLYVQYKTYTDIITHGFISELCGLHQHMLMDYIAGDYTSLETPMPGIIFKNFMQIIRKHSPELVWITSTIKDDRCITRYEGFCKADTLFNYTPMNKTVQTYCRLISSEHRYKFVNCRPMQADGDKINRFHVELRFPDGSLYPAQIAAQNILFGAFLLKAVRLSELGIVETGTINEWTRTKELYRAIRQGSGFVSNRFSNPPTEEEMEEIKLRAIEMLKFLKPEISMYDEKVYRVLMFLAHEPISIMRRTKTDQEINSDFHDLIKSMYPLDTSPYDYLIQAITTMQLTGSLSEKQWIYQLASKHSKQFNQIEKDLFELKKHKNLHFDMELGCYVFK